MIIVDINEWMRKYGSSRLFRMVEYKKLFSNIELEHQQVDNIYKSTNYVLIKIIEVIKLPNDEIFIGYKIVKNSQDLRSRDEKSNIEYRNLNDIELSYCPKDYENIIKK